jgi:hypothetical protein
MAYLVTPGVGAKRVGRGRGPRRMRANNKNLKKTTRKGAYKKPAKRNFQKRRAPFVETKKQEDVTVAIKAKVQSQVVDDTIRLTTAPLTISNGTRAVPGGNAAIANTITMLPLYSFLTMNQGLGASDVNGLSVFSKYLKAKVAIEIPSGQRVIKHPCDLYLVHGWITLPVGSTLHTDPTTDQVTRQYIQTHIQEQLQQYFNQRADKLHFIPKERKNLKILGYRKVKPNLNANLGAQATALQYPNNQGGIVVSGVGSPPIVNMTCNWPLMRKIPYSTGKDGVQANPEGLQHLFPNYSWLPFMVLYNPTALDFLDPNNYTDQYEPKFKVRYNSAHYFSDS